MDATEPDVPPDLHARDDVGDLDRFEVTCSTAEQLFSELPPLGKWWSNPKRLLDTWVFRGQGDARWPLTPSLLRPGALVKACKRFGICDYLGDSTSISRKRFEVETLLAFLQGVDFQGLQLPEDSQEQLLSNPASWWDMELGPSIDDSPWPRRSDLSNLALAQHHGIPTVLLDWTRSPFVALYFAATTAAKIKDASAKIALYGLNETIVRSFGRHGASSGRPQILMVRAPYASNPNLRAQRGTFSVVQVAPDSTPPTIDKALDTVWQLWASDPPDATPGFHLPDLVRYTVPATEAHALLRMLASMDIHAGALFPGHDGVVRWLEERAVWRPRGWS